MTVAEIVELLDRGGPLTGSELMQMTHQEALPLWRACRISDKIRYELVGRRYLRFDRTLDGWVRLSPSIRRQFLTYTVVGSADQEPAVIARAKKLANESDRTSRLKSYLARDVMASTLAELGMGHPLAGKVTVIIAGDIAYRMAHTVPRLESSTGQMVRGSDLDVIVVVADDFPVETLRQLDRAIYRKKHYILFSPSHRQEIDYVIKYVAKVREQLRFDTFQHGVASKILYEGEMLCGSRELFDLIKELVEEAGVPSKIAALERQATDDRAAAEEYLLSSKVDKPTGKYFDLFYTREEHDEIY